MRGRCTDRNCRGGALCPAGGGINCAAWSGDGGMPSLAYMRRCTDRNCPGGSSCPAGGSFNCAAWSATPAVRPPEFDELPASRPQPFDEMPARSGSVFSFSEEALHPPSIPQMRQKGRTAPEPTAKLQSLSGQSLSELQASVASMRSDLRMVGDGQMPRNLRMAGDGQIPKMLEEDSGVGGGARADYRQNRAAQLGHEKKSSNGYQEEDGMVDEDQEYDEEDGEIYDDALDDGTELYLTEAANKWECVFLQRVAKRIHRLVCQQLVATGVDESVLHQFLVFDENLDGTLARAEAHAFLQAVDSAIPGAKKAHRQVASRDGSISFIAFLKWCSDNGKGTAASTISFNLSPFGGGGDSNSRIDALTYDGLKSNVIGYRRLLRQLRRYCDKRKVAAARAEEKNVGLRAAMQVYYDALAKDFEGDEEHLFELFNEVDESGNLMLEADEVEQLVRLLDTAATSGDVRRYLAEMNLDDEPLSFSDLVDWWDQASSNPMSLIFEKGAILIASIKASAAKRRLGGWLTESFVQVSWRKADEERQLSFLRDAYERTIFDFGKYKIDRFLRAAEHDSAEL